MKTAKHSISIQVHLARTWLLVHRVQITAQVFDSYFLHASANFCIQVSGFILMQVDILISHIQTKQKTQTRHCASHKKFTLSASYIYWAKTV